MLEMFSTEIESCAECKASGKSGIHIADRRKCRAESSYVEVCFDCLPKWDRKFGKARIEASNPLPAK